MSATNVLEELFKLLKPEGSNILLGTTLGGILFKLIQKVKDKFKLSGLNRKNIEKVIEIGKELAENIEDSPEEKKQEDSTIPPS